MATTLDALTKLSRTTGPVFITGPEVIVNEAQRQNYIWPKLATGPDGKTVNMQGGMEIRDAVMFDEQSTTQVVGVNPTVTPVNPQTTQTWSDWMRVVLDHMTMDDREWVAATSSGSSRLASAAYKGMMYQKEQRMSTSIANGIDDLLWRVPEASEMEGIAALYPKSIPAHINEFSNGLFYSGWVPSGKTPWTTVQGIDPSVETKWACLGAGSITETAMSATNYNYNSAAITGLAGTDRNIIMSFDKMWSDINYRTPPSFAAAFEDPAFNKQMIVCSHAGFRIVSQLLRLLNDHTRAGPQDPSYNQPLYSGIAIMKCSKLDSAKLYGGETSTDALVTEMAGAGVGEANGPRYYWINGNWLPVVIHSARYFEDTDWMSDSLTPLTYVKYNRTYYNLPRRSARRLGIVSPLPGQDVYSV